MNKKVILSWSGGKDACMALDVLTKSGYEVVVLMTTVDNGHGRTFGHGERRDLILAQGVELGIPVRFTFITNDTYTMDFIRDVEEFKAIFGAEYIAFGDLYIEGHREWGEKVAEKTGLKSLFPLWMKQEEEGQALENFLHSGYQAKIIRVQNDCGLDEWLGQDICADFAKAVSKLPISPMGEMGEYHTFVYGGPLFQKEIPLVVEDVEQMDTTKRIWLKKAKEE